jgi:hypothetical protein
VEGRHNTLLALEKTLQPGVAVPATPDVEEQDRRLNIAVLFTSIPSTLAALKRAGDVARGLGARLTLLVPQVVPYPLPLESPPILLDWNEQRFSVIARESPVDTTVQIYLCRDRMEALERVLSPRSIVVVGARQRWWPTAEMRMARKLRRLGHEVILAETE